MFFRRAREDTRFHSQFFQECYCSAAVFANSIFPWTFIVARALGQGMVHSLFQWSYRHLLSRLLVL